MDLDVLGVDAATGEPLVDNTDVNAIVRLALEEAQQADGYHKGIHDRMVTKTLGLPFGVSELDQAEAGWGVVYAKTVPQQVRDALKPLINHRRGQVPAHHLHVLEVEPGDTPLIWRARHHNAAGSVEPRKIPYYLLLVGDPTEIPFSFQCDLDVEFAVGRICFDDPDNYAAYAESVVKYETEAGELCDRRLIYWGPDRDSSTQKSCNYLVRPLHEGTTHQQAIAEKLGFNARAIIGDQATKTSLIQAIHPDGPGELPPAVLFTASHGMGLRKSDQLLRSIQGALGSHEFERAKPAAPDQYIAGGDISDQARIHGTVAFLFACFSAGTPKHDTYRLVRMGGDLADEPFVAALPKRLLSHPEGGALAVVGHVDLAYASSFHSNADEAAILPFRNFLGHVLFGHPVGHAMSDLNRRYASLSAALGSLIDPNLPDPYNDALGVALKWVQRNDARGFILLGDPACRLRPERLRAVGG